MMTADVGAPTILRDKRVFVETFGCQMNVLDTERAVAQLGRCGYQWTNDLEQADLILLNTCAVRERPAEKVFGRVREVCNRKKGSAIVGVMGCVAQAEGERLIERAPNVRLVVGTQALIKLPELVLALEGGATHLVDITMPNRPDFDDLAPQERRQRHVAYITIMEGCDKFCTFCIVPFTRGRERSRDAERILDEVKSLAQHGYKEVHLLGQNVNSYGLGRRLESGKRTGFSDLLHFLAARSGIQRIKFTTSHPRDFSEKIIDALEEWDELCPWVHLPCQSGSDRILASMNRGYTMKEYMSKVWMIKRSTKEISLTGDIIVGFPGETEEDFRDTVQLVKEAEFDSLYIFKYSMRPGTVAARWTDTVPDVVKTERLIRLNEVQSEIQSRGWRRYLGRITEVLVEGKSAKSVDHWMGHTVCHKVVNFASSKDKLDGLIVRVKITRVNPHSLFGEYLEGVS